MQSIAAKQTQQPLRSIDFLLISLFLLSLPLFVMRAYDLDDLKAFTANQNRTYWQILAESHGWAGTSFYRPVIDLITKFLYQASNGAFFWFKFFQITLFAATLGLLRISFFRLGANFWSAVVALSMLAASRAIHDAFLWWVNVGMAIVVVAFIYSLNVAAKHFSLAHSRDHDLSRGEVVGLFLASLTAVFAKEIGLVVLLVSLVVAYQYRHVKLGMGLGAIVVVFVLARVFIIGNLTTSGGFIATGGFGFSSLQTNELKDLFNDNRLLFYSYNIAAQFLYVLLRQPVEGQFFIYRGGLEGLPTIAYSLVSLGIICYLVTRSSLRKNPVVWLLGAALLANCVLSFPYTRERIMVVGDLAFSLLIALAVVHNHARLKGTWGVGAVRDRPLELAVFLCSVVLFLIASMRSISRFNTKMSAGVLEMRQFVEGNHASLFDNLPAVEGVSDEVFKLVALHYQQALTLWEAVGGK